MGLIKKSVSDIERKVKYARIVMRVLKECKLVKEFVEYTKTDNYLKFFKKKKCDGCDSGVWYDKPYCGNILGSCNFDYYLQETYGNAKSRKYHPYHLVLCYLALFNEEEYIRYVRRYGDDDWIRPYEFINNALCGKNYDQGLNDKDIVKDWINLKETLYGNKN